MSTGAWRRPGRRRLAALAGTVGLSLLMAGCGSTTRPQSDDVDEMKRFVERAYPVGEDFAIDEQRETWSVAGGETELGVEMLLPRSPGARPLLIYLPGLGESVAAGRRWREAWARAGYAVVAMQAQGDATLWSGTRSRNGDFAALAGEQFAPAALATRITRLQAGVAELRRRIAGHEPRVQRIDASRFAVAGFDLGAQAALALAGERPAGTTAIEVPAGLKAVIALSPFARVAAGGLVDRFAEVRTPVLSITGSDDVDALGIVGTALARQAPFRFMPAGGKYLLVVEGGRHGLFAGNPGGGDERHIASTLPPAASGGGDRGKRRGGAPGAQREHGQRHGGEYAGAVAGNIARQSLAIERVALAFLDATLNDDPVAREWLARDTARWLGRLAQWQEK